MILFSSNNDKAQDQNLGKDIFPPLNLNFKVVNFDFILKKIHQHSEKNLVQNYCSRKK